MIEFFREDSSFQACSLCLLLLLGPVSVEFSSPAN